MELFTRTHNFGQKNTKPTPSNFTQGEVIRKLVHPSEILYMSYNLLEIW